MKIGNLISSIALVGLIAAPFAPRLAAQTVAANPTSVSLSAPSGSTNAVSQTLTLTVSGGNGQTLTVNTAGIPSLRVIVASVSGCTSPVIGCNIANPAGSVSVTVQANPTGVAQGTYSGAVNLTITGSANSIQVPVTFAVGTGSGGSGSGVLVPTSTSLTFTALPGGQGQSQNVGISNSGNSITYTASSSATWLTTNLGSNQGSSPGTLTVIASAVGLAANTYNGTLTLTPSGGGQSTTIQVTFVVSSAQQFQINPSALSFSFISGSGSNPSLPVSVGVTTGSPVTYNVSATYGAGATNWLTTNPVSTGTSGTASLPTTVTVTTNAGALAVGTYTATLNFTATGLTTVSVPVTLVVSTPPTFIVNPIPLTINVQPSSSSSRTLSINTSNGAVVGYSVTSQYVNPASPAVQWLTLAGATGSTPGSVTVGVSPATLPVGTYTAQLTIASTTVGVASTTVNVSMVVTNSQIVNANPTTLSFSFVGGGSTPPTQFVLLGLTPNTPIQTATVGAVTDVQGQNWLSATLSSPNGAQITGNAAANVTVNPAGLSNGTYTGKVQINVSTANGPVANPLVEIPVSFTVTGVSGGGGGGGTGATTLLFSQGQINYNLIPGGNADQTLTLTSNTSTQIPFSLSTTAPWLQILNGSGTTTASVTIRASASNLAPGSYSGSILVSAAGASNNGFSIPVSLTISSSNQLQTSPSGLSYNYVAQSGQFPNSQTLQISASTGTTLTVNSSATTTSGGNWLSVTPTSANTLGNFVVSINSTVLQTLAAGSYAGNIVLQAPGALNPTVNIPVSLTITGTSPGGGGGGTGADQLIIGPNPINFFSSLSGGSIQQTLEINTLSGANLSYSLASATISGGNWLTVNPSSGNTPGTVTVQANTGGLSAGSYSGSITVNSTGAINSGSTIPVNLVVSGQTNLTANPGGATFSVPVGSTTLLTRQITVSTTNGTSVPITVTTDSTTNQLTVSTNSNTTPAVITVSLNPAGFTAGVRQGTVFINSGNASNSPMSLPVTLIVTGGSGGGGGTNQLSLSPNSLSFFGQPNGTPPQQRTVSVTSSGSAISYSVSANQPWLQAGPTSGSTPGTITVGVNPSGLAPGSYSGNVSVVGGGSTVNLPVTFEVTNNPLLQVSQSSVTFNLQTGQGLPAPRPILLTTSNGSNLATTVTANTSSGGNWLLASPTSLQTPGAFALSLANSVASTLAAGTYNGTVTVNAPGAANANTTINVTLNVSATPLLTMSTTPMTFNAQFGGSAPPAQSRAITATSGQLSVTVSTSTNTGSGWLTANINTNTTPATISVSASPFGLGTGAYTGTVTVTSGSSSSALVIPVTLNVSSLPLISVNQSELIFGGGGTSGTQPQTIQISSSSNNFNYSVNATVSNSPTNWLSVNNFNAVTPSALVVSVNPALLGDGTYFGTIVISAPGTGNTPLVIPVTLTVNQSTALQVNPATLSFTQLQGGATPAQQAVQVISQLPTAFSATAQVQSPVGGNWLAVTSGGLTNGFLQVSINNTASLLPAGVYTGTINVFGTNSPNTVPITVTLTVVPAASLQVTPATLTFAGRVGQPNPPAQILQLASSNPGAAQVQYNVQTDATWLSATPVSGTTPSTLSVTTNVAGLTAGNYTGRLTITPTGALGGQPSVVTVNLTVEQVPIPNVTGFANAATFQPGSLAPGMIFTLVGTNLGPATAVNGQIVGGRFTTSLVGVRVLFDGVPAPVLFASATQINAVVPYSMAGRASARMTVEYNNIVSNVIEPRLVDTAPGIFTTDGRQAAMFNENGTFNGPANPAPAGSTVVIYVTGEGATNPVGVDGEVIGSNLKRPIGAVRIRVGGIEVPASDIFYAGSAPTLVSGLMQVNFRLPANTPTGIGTQLEIFVGSGQSQPGVTLSVR